MKITCHDVIIFTCHHDNSEIGPGPRRVGCFTRNTPPTSYHLHPIPPHPILYHYRRTSRSSAVSPPTASSTSTTASRTTTGNASCCSGSSSSSWPLHSRSRYVTKKKADSISQTIFFFKKLPQHTQQAYSKVFAATWVLFVSLVLNLVCEVLSKKFPKILPFFDKPTYCHFKD